MFCGDDGGDGDDDDDDSWGRGVPETGTGVEKKTPFKNIQTLCLHRQAPKNICLKYFAPSQVAGKLNPAQ